MQEKRIEAKGRKLSDGGEYEICEFLALHRGQVFSREQIYEHVFGYDGRSDDSAITEHIKTSGQSSGRRTWSRLKQYGDWI